MKRNFLTMLVLSLTSWLMAQNYSISHLGMAESLSNNYVADMTLDKYGFLWIATEEGLNRFDGSYFFTYYNISSNKQSISSNELNCILDDPQEPIMWIGTKNDGLNAYNYDTGDFQLYKHDAHNPNSISTNDITCIAPASDNNIWISTYWKGVQKFDKKSGKFIHYNTQNIKGLPDNQFWCVRELGNGTLLAGHVTNGFSIIDTQKHIAHNFKHNPTSTSSLSGNEVNCIYQDSNGTIWVGTDKGVDIYNPTTHNFTHIAERETDKHRIFDIKEFSDGKIWIGTEQKGIIILNTNNSYHQNGLSVQVIKEGETPYTLTGSTIRCLLEDPYHNVWAGVYGSGVNFLTLHQPPFQVISFGPAYLTNTLSNRSVMGITIDSKNNLWLGTDGNGLNVFSPQKERIATYPKEAGKTVQTAYRDSQGRLWFGSFQDGAFIQMPNGMFKSLMPEYWADIRCFYEDTFKHEMWVGTNQGIYIFDTKSLVKKRFFYKKSKFIRNITKDSKGRIWIGSFDKGIEIYSADMQKRIALLDDYSAPKLPSNAINQLLEDKQHHMWVATNNGIVCFDLQDLSKATFFDQTQGLQNTHVRAICEDDQQNLWLSTNNGISCLRKGSKTFINFDNKDNVPLANFNTASVFHDNNGYIYFGSTDGLCYFSPQAILKPTKSPRVFVTTLRILGGIEQKDSIVDIIMKKEITLKYDENTFCLNFNTQNYAINKNIIYKYKLEGLQDRWTTSDGTITLRNIPYGKYKLYVSTYNNKANSQEDITELSINIRPPFWLSWWAKLLYMLILISILLFCLQIYKRHLHLGYLLKAEKLNHEKELKLNEERLRFFTNITHELRTPLTLILGPLDDISHSAEIGKNIKHKLATIYQSAIKLNELINQILEFRKTETENRQLRVDKGNIVDAVHEICLKYEDLAQKPNVVFRFVAPEKDIETYFDQEVICTITDNLVSNAIKYTQKGSIDISVERRRQDNKHLIDITVSDTGHGISKNAIPHIFDRYYQENGSHQASGTGIGLALVKNLVKLHEGEIKVESTLEQGTSFVFTINEDNIYPHALHGKKHTENKNDFSESSEENMQQKDDNTDTYKKPLLLIVEDNKEILNYIADSFSDDFETITALDGRDGLALALDKIPNVIISDVMMPNMDGNKMCHMLKNDIRTSHIPIILLTAKDSLDAKEEGYDSGADSYITKPFTHSLLQSRIKNLMMQKKRTLLLMKGSESNTNIEQKKNMLKEALSKVDQEFFDKMNKIIKENITGDMDVNILSSQLAMSSSTLYRKMKALTGISTNEYIRKYKMQYAEQLLLEGKYTISEISFMVGMNSVAYFRRCFKAEYGEIPSEYLKKLKEES